MDRAQYLFQNILGVEAVWHAPTVKGHGMAALPGIPDVIVEIAYLQNSFCGVAIAYLRPRNIGKNAKACL